MLFVPLIMHKNHVLVCWYYYLRNVKDRCSQPLILTVDCRNVSVIVCYLWLKPPICVLNNYNYSSNYLFLVPCLVYFNKERSLSLYTETYSHTKPKVSTFYVLTLYLLHYCMTSVLSPIIQWQLKPIWNVPHLLFQTVSKFINRVLGFGYQFTDHVLSLVSIMIPFLENSDPHIR